MKSLIALLLIAGLSACGGSGGGASTANDPPPDPPAEPRQPSFLVTDSDYNALSPLERYAVVNKLSAAMYKGIRVEDFFTLADGLADPQLSPTAASTASISAQLDTPLANYNEVVTRVDEKYFFNEYRQRNTRAYAMALLWELPLSREYFHRWIAYTLANTILFSPAYEHKTVADYDVREVFNRLSTRIDQGWSIRQIVEEHVSSEANWRRFRSPEDNTREMMEIFLLRQNDAEVPIAAKACQNWFLSDDTMAYQLIKTQNINTEPLSVIDTDGIITCEDFYHALAQHADLIPSITRRIIDGMLPEFTEAEKVAFINEIVAEQPETFTELFRLILFSRQYLLQSAHALSYEEAFYPVADRIHWYAGHYYFHNLNDDVAGDNPPDLAELHQQTLSYKLGRETAVPTDTLSFAYYHKLVRDTLMLDRRTATDPANTSDSGWQTSFLSEGEVAGLGDDDYIQLLFLSTLTREADATELGTLKQLFTDQNISNRQQQALIAFDYISRLSELYSSQAH